MTLDGDPLGAQSLVIVLQMYCVDWLFTSGPNVHSTGRDWCWDPERRSPLDETDSPYWTTDAVVFLVNGMLDG